MGTWREKSRRQRVGRLPYEVVSSRTTPFDDTNGARDGWVDGRRFREEKPGETWFSATSEA